MEPRALDGGASSFLFLLCTCMFYNLPVSRFGYRQTEMNHNKFKTNKLTTAASQDQTKNHKSTCSPTCPFRVYRQTEIKHTTFKQTTSQQQPGPNKTENDKCPKKGFLWDGSDGVDHVAREVLQHGVANRGSRYFDHRFDYGASGVCTRCMRRYGSIW